MTTRILVIGSLLAAMLPAVGGAEPARRVEDDGTVHVPAFDLPFSEFASQEMRDAFVADDKLLKELYAQILQGKVAQSAFDEHYYPPLISAQQARYPVDIAVRNIAGIYTEVFTPRDGVSSKNKNRVLINLHGGGFRSGARAGGQVESIPIASLGKLKVVSVDYRQSPQYRFPAASEDVAAVYRELLKEYRPNNIGIYGCSAGGYLAAQALAWFGKNGLPRPGAVGIFGAGAGYGLGQSLYTGAIFRGNTPAPGKPVTIGDLPYMQGTASDDPLANPLKSPAVLRTFPPTLIVNGVQDGNWSESIATHNELVRLGVDARLHLWEGAGHCFLYNPNIPESRDAYAIITKFFDEQLGK
jgi:acetyl esterase/lipase